MLPKKSRLTSPSDFSRATKSGVRVGSDNFLLYFYKSDDALQPRMGLIISKAVGGSVVRHTVARRVRHEIAKHLETLQPGSMVVVRALNGARNADVSIEIPKLLKRAEEKFVVSAR